MTALSESRKKEGLIYAGTDDGNIHITEDGGRNWRKIEKLPELPEYSPYGVYVQRLYASKHDVNTLYALFDDHKNGNYKPYILKSTDKGATWTSIAGDLPSNGPALSLAEDHVNPTCSSAAPSSIILHRRWREKVDPPPGQPADHSGARPRHPGKGERSGAGHVRRGFYVLDDYSPLRQIKADVFNKDSHIFITKKAVIQIPDTARAAALRASSCGWRKSLLRRHHHLLDQGNSPNQEAAAAGGRPRG